MNRYIFEAARRSNTSSYPQEYLVTFIRQRRNGFGMWVEEHRLSLSFPTLGEARAASAALMYVCGDGNV